MIVKKHGAYWLENGWFPFNIGFVADEKDWGKVTKYLKADAPYGTSAGRCTTLINTETGDLCILIAIKHWDTKDAAAVAGLVAHEAVHAFDFMCDHIGEDKPSSEFKAYGVQSFVREVLDCIEVERKKLKKKGKKSK